MTGNLLMVIFELGDKENSFLLISKQDMNFHKLKCFPKVISYEQIICMVKWPCYKLGSTISATGYTGDFNIVTHQRSRKGIKNKLVGLNLHATYKNLKL